MNGIRSVNERQEQRKGFVIAREVSNECLCQKVQSARRSFLIIESKLHLWLQSLQLRPKSRHASVMGRKARAVGEDPAIFMKIFLDIPLMFLLPVADCVAVCTRLSSYLSKQACILAPKCPSTQPRQAQAQFPKSHALTHNPSRTLHTCSCSHSGQLCDPTRTGSRT